MTLSLRTISLALSGLILLPVAVSAAPDPEPDPAAAVVLLRKNCGDPALENCFESMSDLTTTGNTGWIWQTRKPSALAPLLIDIGPGEFGPFMCTGANRGHVTLRGSGREQTILKDAVAGVNVTNCKNLSFMDLGAHGTYGVYWQGSLGGSSSWSNVDLVGLSGGVATAGWADDNCTDQLVRSVHYFHGSRIRAIGPANIVTTAFFTRCSESWIFGGELLVNLTQGSTNFPAVLWINGGFVEAFGTAIRGRMSGSAVSPSGEIIGATLFNTSFHSLPATFHSHGVNIGLNTASASDATLDVVAISASDGVVVHSPGTAYALTPGPSGSTTRVRVTDGTPSVEAPFHWSAGTEPPAISSKDGEDLFVETDCTSTSCSGGNQPHLMIYAPNACTSGSPWWDVARNDCRQ